MSRVQQHLQLMSLNYLDAAHSHVLTLKSKGKKSDEPFKNCTTCNYHQGQ